MNFSATITDDTCTVLVNTKLYTVHRSAAHFDTVRDLLNDPATTAEQMLAAVNPEAWIKNTVTSGAITVGNGAVWRNGVQVHNALTRRLLNIASQGFDIEPWVKFTDKVYQNPYAWAVDELFLWLETNNMPITPEGNFIAYKKIRGDYSDIYSGRFNNYPGTTVTLPGGRECVDKDRSRTCSTGLHFCSASYLPYFGVDSGTRVVLVEIDPRDVVAIPNDYNNAKGRCWRYKVVGEVSHDEAQAMIWPAVQDFGVEYDDDDWDDDLRDWEDDDDDWGVLSWDVTPAPAPVEESPLTDGIMRRIQRFVRKPRG